MDRTQRVINFFRHICERAKLAKLPQRPNEHQLEELSRRFFIAALPRNWTHHAPSDDYGVDLNVDLFNGDAATGLELLVQLKSSAKAEDGEHESIRLKVSTYNYLRNRLPVVMLTKFVESSDEAYWILLRDLPVPDLQADSFTVNIPKANSLSSIDWTAIYRLVEQVSDAKRRAERLQEIKLEGPGQT